MTKVVLLDMFQLSQFDPYMSLGLEMEANESFSHFHPCRDSTKKQ